LFAAIEHELNFMVYAALKLSPARGRLSVTRQNVRGRMDLLKELFALEGLGLPPNWAALTKELEDIETVRDWVAHGVWSSGEAGPTILITKGHWSPPGLPFRMNRKVVPAGAPLSPAVLRGISDAGEDLLAHLEEVHADIIEHLEGKRPLLPRRKASRPQAKPKR
jgi:hypothetical protein